MVMKKEKRISFCQGKGSLTHNNRDFIAENVDRSRIKDNYTFIKKDLGTVYEHLFAESTERYNAKQKRNDRKINCSYYESLFRQKPSNTVVTAADKRKSFYEDDKNILDGTSHVRGFKGIRLNGFIK